MLSFSNSSTDKPEFCKPYFIQLTAFMFRLCITKPQWYEVAGSICGSWDEVKVKVLKVWTLSNISYWTIQQIASKSIIQGLWFRILPSNRRWLCVVGETRWTHFSYSHWTGHSHPIGSKHWKRICKTCYPKSTHSFHTKSQVENYRIRCLISDKPRRSLLLYLVVSLRNTMSV